MFDFTVTTETRTTGATRDIITDFVHLTDKIDLSTIDAISGGANDGFSLSAPRRSRPPTRCGQSNRVHAILNVNTSGVGGAESAIQLSDVTATTLTDVDFVL